ncbi:multiprotein-bridging factor 1 family protein [Methylobacterium sp. A54F]
MQFGAIHVNNFTPKKCNFRSLVISAAQCRAARALIGWSRDQLAEAAHVSLRTIVDFERGARDPHRATLDALERALWEAGVTTDLHQGSGAGVRLVAEDCRSRKQD